MRNISIVGAGQAGLQLALGLQSRGYNITLITDREAEAVRDGRILSSQVMFGPALDIERRCGIAMWDEECPPLRRLTLTLVNGDRRMTFLDGMLMSAAQSVDQRLKLSTWQQLFLNRGGALHIKQVAVADLEMYAADSDLVVIATGKGEIGKLFGRNQSCCRFDVPQRSLSLTYLMGVEPASTTDGIAMYQLPRLGEVLITPALTGMGRCEVYNFEAIPGSAMDCWTSLTGAAEHLACTRALLKRYLPWEAERTDRARLADAQATLIGAVTPTVRHPVATLPSGAKVMGIADAVCLNDPITGQGANTAARAAAWLQEQIVARGDASFDETWMHSVFEQFWSYASQIVAWTNVWLAPMPLHVMKLMRAASRNPQIANEIINGFSNPLDVVPLFVDQREAVKYLRRYAGPVSPDRSCI
jgi:hypothetical protein